MDQLQPQFSTLLKVERRNFRNVYDTAELGEHFETKKSRTFFIIGGARLKKPIKSLFDVEKINVLEHFLKFFLVISRF